MSANRKAIVIAGGLMTFLAPLPAFAHPMKGVGDFYAGMLHPVTTIETALPIVVLSLLAGQQRREAAINVLAAFPGGLLFGAMLATLKYVPFNLGMVQLALAWEWMRSTTMGMGGKISSSRTSAANAIPCTAIPETIHFRM